MCLQTQVHPKESTIEYNTEEARVIGTILQYFEVMKDSLDRKTAKQFMQRYKIKNRIKSAKKARKRAQQYVQSYSLKSGLKKFGDKGKESTKSEMQQLLERDVFIQSKSTI